MVTRRQILATMGIPFTGPMAGCLDTVSDGSRATDDETITPVESQPSTPQDDHCGSGEQALSTLLTDDPGDPENCFDGATPSFTVENERSDPVTVSLDLVPTDQFAETYTLDPGERVVESSAFEAQPGIGGTVSLDNEQDWTVEWTERSCHRYGIALLPADIHIGWVKPLQGPGDTQHDCYPGTDVPLEVGVAGKDRIASVTIADRCAETVFEQTIEISADEREQIHGELVSGGIYDITVDVEDGGFETVEFHEGCWGVVAGVSEDGDVQIEQIPID